MTRRSIIRGFAIILLLLCIGAWMWSAGHYSQINYATQKATFSCLMESSMVAVTVGNGQKGSLRVSTSFYAIPMSRLWPAIRVQSGDSDFGDHYYAGFSFQYTRTEDDWDLWCGVPLWFLTLICSLAALFVWRKTRPKPDPRTAFPVEANPAAQAGPGP